MGRDLPRALGSLGVLLFLFFCFTAARFQLSLMLSHLVNSDPNTNEATPPHRSSGPRCWSRRKSKTSTEPPATTMHPVATAAEALPS